MIINASDTRNMNLYFSGKDVIGYYAQQLPRKKKKEYKKSYIFYNKELDIVVITKGNKRKELSFKKIFTDMENIGFGVDSLNDFILQQISKL